MSERETDVLLEDIRECLDKILRYTQDMDEEAFLKNDLVIDAVLRNIEVIGEAASKLPKSFADAHPGIEWNKMVGMRNRLIHGYFGTSLKLVWQTIQTSMPELREKLNLLGF